VDTDDAITKLLAGNWVAIGDKLADEFASALDARNLKYERHDVMLFVTGPPWAPSTATAFHLVDPPSAAPGARGR
jgi:hypothetical protein